MAKITEEGFLQAVEDSGGIITTIAKRIGVARISLYDWLERHPEMKTFIYQEQEKMLDLAETRLLQKVNEGQDWSIKYILSTRGKNRGYSEKPEIQMNVQNNIGLSKEEYQRLLEVL